MTRTRASAKAAGTRMCSCGCTFVDTASGRHNHRVLLGHTPVRVVHMTPRERVSALLAEKGAWR